MFPYYRNFLQTNHLISMVRANHYRDFYMLYLVLLSVAFYEESKHPNFSRKPKYNHDLLKSVLLFLWANNFFAKQQ